ncbi:hypothetical protein [Streptomyces sp. NPDC101132]|uniref:hypothetical protein n=1 Tax=Streptomyces sp. NPDC101132 TaxID=3366110 RepID=UPI003821FEAF
MPLFVLGLVLGVISGGFTYGLTADGGLASLVGVGAAVATWLGVALLVVVDD